MSRKRLQTVVWDSPPPSLDATEAFTLMTEEAAREHNVSRLGLRYFHQRQSAASREEEFYHFDPSGDFSFWHERIPSGQPVISFMQDASHDVELFQVEVLAEPGSTDVYRTTWKIESATYDKRGTNMVVPGRLPFADFPRLPQYLMSWINDVECPTDMTVNADLVFVTQKIPDSELEVGVYRASDHFIPPQRWARNLLDQYISPEHQNAPFTFHWNDSNPDVQIKVEHMARALTQVTGDGSVQQGWLPLSRSHLHSAVQLVYHSMFAQRLENMSAREGLEFFLSSTETTAFCHQWTIDDLNGDAV